MTEMGFNNQALTALYRDWFILNRIDPLRPYDKKQVDDLFILIKTEISQNIDELFRQPLFAYRAKIPFVYINFRNFEKFNIEIFVYENIIKCVNIPGCMVESNNIQASFDNLIKAVIQCVDARRKNNLLLTNRVNPLVVYDYGIQSINSKSMVETLKEAGSIIEYVGPYHTILLRKGSKVTFTILNDSIISSNLHYGYNSLRIILSNEQYYEMYGCLPY